MAHKLFSAREGCASRRHPALPHNLTLQHSHQGLFFLVCLLLAARLVPLADGSIPQRGCPLGPWIIEAIYRCRILSCELCRVDLSANRNANLEARASNRTIIQPSNDSCANYRTRGSWCLPTEPRRSSGWCLGTKRVLFSCLRPCFIA